MVKQDIIRGFGWIYLPVLTDDMRQWTELTTVCVSGMERI